MILEMVLATEASHSVSVWSWLLGPVQNQHVRITGLRWWLGGLKRGGGAQQPNQSQELCANCAIGHVLRDHVQRKTTRESWPCRATSHSVRSGTGVGSSDHAFGTPEDVKVARAIKLVLEGEAWDVEPLFSMRPMRECRCPGHWCGQSALATFFFGWAPASGRRSRSEVRCGDGSCAS